MQHINSILQFSSIKKYYLNNFGYNVNVSVSVNNYDDYYGYKFSNNVKISVNFSKHIGAINVSVSEDVNESVINEIISRELNIPLSDISYISYDVDCCDRMPSCVTFNSITISCKSNYKCLTRC